MIGTETILHFQVKLFLTCASSQRRNAWQSNYRPVVLNMQTLISWGAPYSGGWKSVTCALQWDLGLCRQADP